MSSRINSDFIKRTLVAASGISMLKEDVAKVQSLNNIVIHFRSSGFFGEPDELASKINNIITSGLSLLEKFKHAKFIDDTVDPAQKTLKKTIIDLHSIVENLLIIIINHCLIKAQYKPVIVKELIKQDNSYITEKVLSYIAQKALNENVDHFYINAGQGLGEQVRIRRKKINPKEEKDQDNSLGKMIASNTTEIEKINKKIDDRGWNLPSANEIDELNKIFVISLELLRKLSQQNDLLRDEDPFFLPLSLNLHAIHKTTHRDLIFLCTKIVLQQNDKIALFSPALITTMIPYMLQELRVNFAEPSQILALFFIAKTPPSPFAEIAKEANALYAPFHDNDSKASINEIYDRASQLKEKINHLSIDKKDNFSRLLLHKLNQFANQLPEKICEKISMQTVFTQGSLQLKIDFCKNLSINDNKISECLSECLSVYGSKKIQLLFQHLMDAAAISKNLEREELKEDDDLIRADKMFREIMDKSKIAPMDELEQIIMNKIFELTRNKHQRFISNACEYIIDQAENTTLFKCIFGIDNALRIPLCTAVIDKFVFGTESMQAVLKIALEQQNQIVADDARVIDAVNREFMEFENEIRYLKLPREDSRKTIDASKALNLVNQVYVKLVALISVIGTHQQTFSPQDIEYKLFDCLQKMIPPIEKFLDSVAEAAVKNRLFEIALHANGNAALQAAIQAPLAQQKEFTAKRLNQTVQQFDQARDIQAAEEEKYYFATRSDAKTPPATAPTLRAFH